MGGRRRESGRIGETAALLVAREEATAEEGEEREKRQWRRKERNYRRGEEREKHAGEGAE